MFLLAVFAKLAFFAKNEKADLTAAERNALGRSVATMLDNYRKRK